MKQYDLAVFIGRFQPFHWAHYEVIKHALTKADRVLVLVGSSNQPRDIRNPFTFEERRNVIMECFNDDWIRIKVEPLEDRRYNDAAWVNQVQQKVKSVCMTDNLSSVALIGHDKEDGTGYYLKLFPQWDSISAGLRREGANSTEIRQLYFSVGMNRNYNSLTPPATTKMLSKFCSTIHYDNLVKEYEYKLEHDRKWWVNPRYHEELAQGKRPVGVPFPVLFQTVDAVVVQSAHILLVKRKEHPGKGNWALPGGYLNPRETLLDGTIRELFEETKIKVPEAVLRGSIIASQTFDDPTRSPRGRVITNATLFHLKPDLKLPKVKGADDAEIAKWWALSDISRPMMFEDHMDIIINMVSRL